MKTQTIALLLCLTLLSGCTSVRVHSVDPAAQMLHVCIQENPKVAVDDFVSVLRDGFDRHGISTEVFQVGKRPARCEFVMTYTALRSWDMGAYLSHAELRIEKAGRAVASAQYHLRGKGGFSLTKWVGTKTKMDPVIDQLLAGSKSAPMAPNASSESLTSRVPAVEPPAAGGNDTVASRTELRLRELQQLKDQGLISEQEFIAKRRVVLGEI